MPDIERLAQEAHDSAKSAHKRLDTLELEVNNIHELTAAMVGVQTQVKNVETSVGKIEVKLDDLTAKPGKLQDKLIAAALTALATGLVGAILALILK